MKACEVVAAENMNIRGMTREKVNTAAMKREVLLQTGEGEKEEGRVQKGSAFSLHFNRPLIRFL